MRPGGRFRLAHRSPDRSAFSCDAPVASTVRRLLFYGALAGACAGTPAIAKIRVPGLARSHVTTRAVQLGDWKLKVVTGTFSGDMRCHLFDPKHHIVYAAGALGFHFRHHVNTLGAWMRIDGGPAKRWQDSLPELTRLGVPMDGRSLDNPTDSTVWVPATLLTDANRIAIQSREDRSPRVFHLHGFAGLRDIARDMGCVPEGRFIP